MSPNLKEGGVIWTYLIIINTYCVNAIAIDDALYVEV